MYHHYQVDLEMYLYFWNLIIQLNRSIQPEQLVNKEDHRKQFCRLGLQKLKNLTKLIRSN